MARLANILDRSPADLEALLAGRDVAIEELDFATGEYRLLRGASLPLRADAVSYQILIGSMAVGRYLANPGACPDPESVAHALGLLYQRNWTYDLLNETIDPIPVDIEEGEYLARLAKRILFGTRARYIIVRLKTGLGELSVYKAVSVIDLTQKMPTTLSDFDVGTDHPCIEIYRASERGIHTNHTRVLRRTTDQDVFRSMTTAGSGAISTILIVPISIGGTVTGFVNVGYDIDFPVDKYLDLTFGSIFNHAFAAYEHYKRLNELSAIRSIQVKDFVNRTLTEILQGFRHVAQNALYTGRNALEEMTKYYKYQGKSDDPVHVLKQSLVEIQAALSNMAALRLGNESKEVCEFPELIQEAVNFVGPQIAHADATVRINPPAGTKGFAALVDPSSVRTAFVNLLLNSIQAFEQGSTRRSDRKITINVSRIGDLIKITYADEGPGIRFGGDIRQIKDIWVPGKTSKRDGSGYGLPAARDIFQHQHDGSIDLMRSARGVLFQIVLSDGLTSAH